MLILEALSAEVLSGIPQGSVLGPTLFIIYINDLPGTLKGHVKIFVDDTKGFSHIRDEKDCAVLQHNLDRLSDLSVKCQLKFNVGKCGVIHYGHQKEECMYYMGYGDDRTNLSVRSEEKDLG